MLEAAIAITLLVLKYGRRVWYFSYEQLDRLVLSQEERYGVRGWGIRLTGLLLAAVALYVRPSSHASFMGKYYAQLAADPFGFDPSNPVPHRIATSLISYLIGMRGQLIIVTNIIITAILILSVYLYFRRNATRPGDAFLSAAIMASSFIVLATIYFGGYNDALSWLLLFAMWAWRERRILFYSAFALALFNRETILFLVPWLVFISFEKTDLPVRRSIELIIGLAAVIGGYLVFRTWLGRHQPIEYSSGYYVGPFLDDPLHWIRDSFSHLGLGCFSIFKALWVVPLLAVLSAWLKGNFRLVLSIVLLGMCALAQLFFAYDTSRLVAMSFPVMILGLEHLFRTGDFGFRRWIGPVVVLSLLIPNFAVAGNVIDVMKSLLSYLIEHSLGA